MLPKHLNKINFLSILAKVEKAASRKGQMKLLLLDVYTKIKKMQITGFIDFKIRCQ